MAQIIKSATDQRRFTMVYNDFLESDLLDYFEKMVFIALKRYADNDTLRAFPSLKTLQRITGISISKIRRSIEHMQELGVIGVEHRTDNERGHQSNVYTLYDYAQVWKIDGSKDDVTDVTEKIDEAKMITELISRGYKVTKEKEPNVAAPAKVTASLDSKNQYTDNNITQTGCKSQDVERYSYADIQTLYQYDVLVNDYPLMVDEIDTVFSILYDTLNQKKPTIRIAGNDKPTMVVVGRLMKLDGSNIIYAIRKFYEQTEKIKNPTAYMLTLLYGAKEQMNLDIINQVQHDMLN